MSESGPNYVTWKGEQPLPQVHSYKQQGSYVVLVDGELVRVPAELTITETTYPGTDRKDVCVTVPRLSTAAIRKEVKDG